MSSRSMVAPPCRQLDPHLYSVIAEHALLRTLLKTLADGVLLLTPQKEWLYGNDRADQICQQFNLGKPLSATIPDQIWRACQWFLNDASGSAKPSVFETTIRAETGNFYRARMQWLHLEETSQPCFMLLLEDCQQTSHNRAIAEAKQYRLTERQSEVWLLHRKGHSYREIATQLFITLNTVKRHLKDIHAKQKISNSG